MGQVQCYFNCPKDIWSVQSYNEGEAQSDQPPMTETYPAEATCSDGPCALKRDQPALPGPLQWYPPDTRHESAAAMVACMVFVSLILGLFLFGGWWIVRKKQQRHRRWSENVEAAIEGHGHVVRAGQEKGNDMAEY